MADTHLPSDQWDKREKENLEMLYSSAEDCTIGLPLMSDSGLLDIILSKFPDPKDLKERNYAFYALSVAFRDYSQFWDGKRKTREYSKDGVKKFLAHYKLDKNPKILKAVESTYDLIDAKKRSGL